MNFEFDQTTPIYQQLVTQLSELMLTGVYQAGERIPSTTQLSQELHINPATVRKAMNILVDQGLLVKQRGIGMFVTDQSQAMIVKQHQDEFFDEYVVKVIAEAKRLGISQTELMSLIERGYDHGNN
ncbi:GntR family transcriptional regulator [Limosilactobacillus equigenerosi]|uniref:GntR family transcriptional regulator n=1 Tax=Limosilactobacillus equigenerosi TaxID=417373 RepID=UPI0006CF943E|nr:GntR family transcriptional regulator [Limosilactobacillus equigenerosi]